jgi:hypothetical protein
MPQTCQSHSTLRRRLHVFAAVQSPYTMRNKSFGNYPPRTCEKWTGTQSIQALWRGMSAHKVGRQYSTLKKSLVQLGRILGSPESSEPRTHQTDMPRNWCRSKTIRIGPMTRRNVAKRLPRYGLMPSPVSTIMAGSKKCPRTSSAGFKRNGDGCNSEEDSSQDPTTRLACSAVKIFIFPFSGCQGLQSLDVKTQMRRFNRDRFNRERSHQ